MDNHLFHEFKKIYIKFIQDDYLSFFNERDLDLFLLERWNFIFKKVSDINIKCYNSKDAWPYHTSIIEVNLLDMPFIVDTIVDFLKSQKLRIYRLINAILFIKRKEHQIIDISSKHNPELIQESYIYIELEKLDDNTLIELQERILLNLKELQIIVKDFQSINEILNHIEFDNPDLNQDKDWIKENFIHMGYGFIQSSNIKNELGLLVNKNYKDIVLEELQTQNIKSNEDIIFKESSIKSNVKRYKPLHIVIFKQKQDMHVLLGSIAGKGELSPRFLIPPIKRKLDQIAYSLNASYNGYKYKEIYKISQLIPLGILFSRNMNLLKEWFEFLIDNLYTNEQKILITEDKENHSVLVLLIELQKFIDPYNEYIDKLKSFDITIKTHFKRTYNQFIYTFLILTNNNIKKLKSLLNKEKDNIFYSWYDHFIKYITYKESSLKELKVKSETYRDILPPALTSYISPKEALKNLNILETITNDQKFYVKFSKSINILETPKKEVLTINIYSCENFTLTEIFPILDSIGLNITTEVSFDFDFPQGKRYLNIIYIQNEIPVEWIQKIESGIEEILNNKHSVEKINELLIKTKLTIREIQFIKTFINYYYQLNKQYSRLYLINFIINNLEFSEYFITYLNEVFDIKKNPNAMSKKDKLLEQLKKYVLNLKTISEQTIGFNLIEILENLLRTNYFLNLEEIAIKVHTKKISYLNEPKPLFEIFVYSRDLEGIHIRSDYIARGGIRWSDRLDDYRIEIYDLMKTQMIKNTIIVPNGAKGGYIIKKSMSHLNKKEVYEISKFYYKKFISNLISITDNYDNHKNIITPQNVIKLDSDDPYLVVAADKGTATFSDTANEISNENQFWLKDAFASGGSFGYDHKKQGITAKGAWESVKRHFSERNINPEKDTIYVIGIGDMSGDVFGNGMLLSKSIKLIAAFNHVHIFVDPEPDPETSYQERLRLFKEVKGWDEYNQNLISKGGGVFLRNSARIKISKEMKERFDIAKDYASGEELIQYILKSKADLLWNGGIGTYIKASTENHKDVKDPANDNVRINAKELKVKVIGEGGNLGLTPKARIEAYRHGVQLNTDFIDNSGGVDMSDHEVNLKIFLNDIVDQNIISFEERNHLLKQYESQMILKVLSNNRWNNLAIALEKYHITSYIFLLSKWIEILKKENIIQEQELELQGDITGPEICTLLGYTKLYFKNHFYQNHLDIQEELSLFVLKSYFPSDLIDKYQDYILKHPLKNKIIYTFILNELINSLGSLHFYINNKILNKNFKTIFSEYLQFKYFYQFNLLDLYNKYYILPKGFLYEQLFNISNTTRLIHFLINNYQQILNNNELKIKFNENIKQLIKILNKNNNIIIPIGDNKIKKEAMELYNFSSSYKIALLHLFLGNELEIQDFYNLINENHLNDLLEIINNLTIVNEQELKFQARLLIMYFNIIKEITKKSAFIKKQSNIKDYLKTIKENKDLKLIDVFEILIEIEMLIK